MHSVEQEIESKFRNIEQLVIEFWNLSSHVLKDNLSHKERFQCVPSLYNRSYADLCKTIVQESLISKSTCLDLKYKVRGNSFVTTMYHLNSNFVNLHTTLLLLKQFPHTELLCEKLNQIIQLYSTSLLPTCFTFSLLLHYFTLQLVDQIMLKRISFCCGIRINHSYEIGLEHSDALLLFERQFCSLLQTYQFQWSPPIVMRNLTCLDNLILDEWILPNFSSREELILWYHQVMQHSALFSSVEKSQFLMQLVCKNRFLTNFSKENFQVLDLLLHLLFQFVTQQPAILSSIWEFLFHLTIHHKERVEQWIDKLLQEKVETNYCATTKIWTQSIATILNSKNQSHAQQVLQETITNLLGWNITIDCIRIVSNVLCIQRKIV